MIFFIFNTRVNRDKHHIFLLSGLGSKQIIASSLQLGLTTFPCAMTCIVHSLFNQQAS